MSEEQVDSERRADPDNRAIVSTFLQKAEEAAAQNRTDDARAWMEGVVELDSANVDAWLRLANLIPDPRERMQCYARVLELSPGHPQARAGIRKARREQTRNVRR